MLAAGAHSLVAGARRILAVGHSRVAAGEGLGSPGVVAQVGRETGRGWDRAPDRTGVEAGRCSLAAGMNHGAGVGMRPGQESVEARFQDAPQEGTCTNLSLGRVWTMRRAILVVGLLPITLALRGVALVIALALLSMLRAVVAIVLLAVAAAAIVVVTRHIEVKKWV
jgi:hypothetical protein